MKTAEFEYTHSVEVDSSLADTLFYNENTQEMAIQFHYNGHNTPSVMYGQVPRGFFDGFASSNSIGKVYNSYVKSTFPSLSYGTVYDVTYVNIGDKVAGEDSMEYIVMGYVRHKAKIPAKDSLAAIQIFVDGLVAEGYEPDEIAVTEVEISRG